MQTVWQQAVFLIKKYFLQNIYLVIILKIKVILTGGTIGSEKQSGIVHSGVSRDIVSYWLEKCSEEKSRNIEFFKVSPYSVLSENISLDNWQALTEELTRDYSEFEGVIITHGSDTLSYTSAMVSIYCKDFPIPVVLTGANKVLSDKESNGYGNFDKAVDIVKQGKTGVWTVFDNVYSADSVMEADYYTDSFSRGNTPQQEVILKSKEKIIFKNKVMIIKEYPFADYRGIVIDSSVKAVLVIGYHSGTANEKAIDLLYEKCKKQGVELYLQGLNSESAVYSSTDKMRKRGVNIIYNDTPEYAFAKLMFKVNGYLC